MQPAAYRGAKIFESDIDGGAFGAVSDRVVEKVSEHLQHSIRIEETCTISAPFDVDLPVGTHGPNRGDRRLGTRGEFGRLPPARNARPLAGSGVVEQISNKPVHLPDVAELP